MWCLVEKPVDVCFGSYGHEGKSHSHHVEELRKDLQSAFQLAAEAATKVHLRNKRSHDKVLRHQVLETGDSVLMENLGLRGKRKLHSWWNPLPYVVVEKIPDIPVYWVKPESGMGKVQTIHRDHLLPIRYMVRMPDENDVEFLGWGPKTDPQRKAELDRKQNLKVHRVF